MFCGNVTVRCRGWRQQFLFRASKNSKGYGWPRDLHHPEKVAGFARLPQVDAGDGWGPGPTARRRP